MRHPIWLIGGVVIAAWTLACGERATPSSAEVAPASASTAGAMCSEHGVLEAVCTKCNPALIPVFKARGDWCDEHGFPESFCPTCHPERGGRPAAALGADDASPSGTLASGAVVSGAAASAGPSSLGPEDGIMVRFLTRETARLAGLRFVVAVAQPVSREVIATARVRYDAARVAQINARMPGVVSAIRADVGTAVTVNSPLAIIESAGVGAEQSRLQAGRVRLEVAEANYTRVEMLRSEEIMTERDLLAARREREDARADVRSASAALGMVGAVARGSARYTLTSPIAGVVTERGATIGRLVDADDTVFEVVDASTMWVDLDVPESELALVAVGQTAIVMLDGVPGREFSGTISYLAPTIDTRTRTALARIPLDNADGALRANLFGRGRIAVTDPRAVVLVPRAAVQRARDVNLVFVRVAEDAFEGRRVIVGPASGDLLSVVGRVQAGDAVVTEGSFLLKTETLKESIGAGCCEVD